MATEAVVIVPPLLKMAASPLLGPAMLVGAGRAAGHHVRVLDLNERWLHEQLGPQCATSPSGFVGDHDRPSERLREIEAEFVDSVSAATARLGGSRASLLRMTLSHEELSEAARGLAESTFGGWVTDALAGAAASPDVIGVSVMYSGQVLAGLTISIVARRLWPRALIVWGGAHVTALRSEIVKDERYGEFIDKFVFGYAERTWAEILDAFDVRRDLPTAAVTAGSGALSMAADDLSVVPAFDGVTGGVAGRLTLPAQASRGCAYGRCAFCTYPAIEGVYRPGAWDSVSAVIGLAAELGAAVSFKDSLVLPQRLQEIAQLADGRVRWSACTKLHATFTAPFMQFLADAGCATIEVGLETLAPSGQLLIDKKQSMPLLLGTLDAAASAGISVVVNYITGFPGVDADDEARYLGLVSSEMAARPALRAKLEHNTFQLERLSPMGLNPQAYGLRVMQTWPWSSVVAWAPAPAALTPAGSAGQRQHARLPVIASVESRASRSPWSP